MAGRRVSFGQHPSGAIATALVLLVFLQATLVWKESTSAPGRRDDVLAGTEFLSVFINGAMAQPPIRRRGSRRGGTTTDNVAAESQRQEASIYRISRTSRTSSAAPPRREDENESRVSPISQKSVESSASLTSLLDNLSTASEIGSMLTPRSEPVSQKVIGVSVTSTVEATPYKVRVEHHVDDEMTTASRTAPTTTPITFVTPLPALTAADELSNIVSESNRSEFSVDEGAPRTNWRLRPRTTTPRTRGSRPSHRHHRKEASESVEATGPDGKAPHPQGRKAGRHYQTLLFTQHPSRLYAEAEPARVYSEPARVYSEPAKVYSEPAKVYGEPERVYSEPSKVYSEPAKVYSEPAKVYSEPARVYGEPAKVYGPDGRPVKPSDEPEEQNYEVDEAVSVGSNGNVHGLQAVTEPSGPQEPDDGHKVGYVVEGRNYRRYRVEERTPDGFIVGEYGVVSHDDGSLRGVRYTADSSINPQLIHETLMKFLAL
ncbi:uncharacterized protein LOC124303451 [Neodiprion virginianus]|uniref:uncharacterized protein LOC124303451 n=1 Tax=Neodiprion virginianus TaxID=2961670 RepID=UPI001EE6EC44|nr:uncharacterized protein LOC124303451 [Neodiprion virginianus]